VAEPEARKTAVVRISGAASASGGMQDQR